MAIDTHDDSVTAEHRLPMGSERRAAERWSGGFAARIRGVDAGGQPFDATTLVDNVSAGGLYAQVLRAPAMGAKVFSLVSLPGSVRLAAKGRVVRVEPRAHGLWGIGVMVYATRPLWPARNRGDVGSE